MGGFTGRAGGGTSVELGVVAQQRVAVSVHVDLAGRDVGVYLTLGLSPGSDSSHVFADYSYLFPDRTSRTQIH